MSVGTISPASDAGAIVKPDEDERVVAGDAERGRRTYANTAAAQRRAASGDKWLRF